MESCSYALFALVGRLVVVVAVAMPGLVDIVVERSIAAERRDPVGEMAAAASGEVLQPTI
jgi:hypothetical protein